jgi:predicted ATP-dependent endonuclease of OLD family
MKLVRLRVRNFRCFCGEDWWEWIPNGDLNLLIGPNGSGKTAVLDAIDFVLNWEGRTNRSLITEYDFPYCDTCNTIEIEATLTDIGTDLADFISDIQWVDKETLDPIDGSDEEPDEEKHERAVIVRFEAARNQEDGDIRWKWLLPKFPSTDMEGPEELSRQQHEAIGYFRIRPAISEGAFTLGEYSALGRHLRKLRYKLGRLPEKLKPISVMPECILGRLDCAKCDKREDCSNEIEDGEGDTAKGTPLGELLSQIISKAGSMLGENAWAGMEKSLGPRFGGLRSSLTAITVGLRPSDSGGFLPFERLSAGEKYALSFAMATTQVAGSVMPILVMEEPETALYPAAIGQITAALQSANSPQVIVSSHSESVVRRFAISDIFRIGKDRKPNRLDRMITDEGIRWAAEQLAIPGSTSVLFADKVLVVEGDGDAFAIGEMDRIAGSVRNGNEPQKSFASLGWTVLSASKAENVPDTVEALKQFGIGSIAALFDGDQKGLESAEQTKERCPTFAYRSSKDAAPILELALLFGLDNEEQNATLDAFQTHEQCKNCRQKNDVKNCLGKNGCQLPSQIKKDRLKAALRKCCLKQYREKKVFPPAFRALCEQIDNAKAGKIICLDIDGQ